MPISLRCPTCGAAYSVSESLIGRKLKCKGCSSAFTVPIASENVPPPPPPPSETKEWHVAINGVQQGPYTRTEVMQRISAGMVPLGTLAWCNRMGDWQPVEKLPEFSGCFQSPPPRNTAASAAVGTPPPPPLRTAGPISHAQVGPRLAASLIDMIVTIPLIVIVLVISLAFADPFGHVSFAVIFVSSLACLFLFSLYNACLEQTHWQGSVGKKLLGLYVTDEQQLPLTFALSFWRNTGKCLVFVPFLFCNSSVLFLGSLIVVVFVVLRLQKRFQAGWTKDFWYDRKFHCLVQRRIIAR